MAEFINKDETEKKLRKLAYYYFDKYYADKTDLESRYRALGYERAADEIRMTVDVADVQPAKRGHWINDGDCLICSYCHTAYSSWFRGSNYCAECGADMRGEEQ